MTYENAPGFPRIAPTEDKFRSWGKDGLIDEAGILGAGAGALVRYHATWGLLASAPRLRTGWDPTFETYHAAKVLASPGAYDSLHIIGGKLYTFDGWTPLNSNLQNPFKVREYDPATDAWTDRNPVELYQEIVGATAVGLFDIDGEPVVFALEHVDVQNTEGHSGDRNYRESSFRITRWTLRDGGWVVAAEAPLTWTGYLSTVSNLVIHVDIPNNRMWLQQAYSTGTSGQTVWEFSTRPLGYPDTPWTKVYRPYHPWTEYGADTRFPPDSATSELVAWHMVGTLGGDGRLYFTAADDSIVDAYDGGTNREVVALDAAGELHRTVWSTDPATSKNATAQILIPFDGGVLVSGRTRKAHDPAEASAHPFLTRYKTDGSVLYRYSTLWHVGEGQARLVWQSRYPSLQLSFVKRTAPWELIFDQGLPNLSYTASTNRFVGSTGPPLHMPTNEEGGYIPLFENGTTGTRITNLAHRIRIEPVEPVTPPDPVG